MTLSIDRMYAFIAVDEDGEGVCGFTNPRTGMWMPMVGADLDRIDELRPIAQFVADQSGKRLVLAHFEHRRDVEVIEPCKCKELPADLAALEADLNAHHPECPRA